MGNTRISYEGEIGVIRSLTPPKNSIQVELMNKPVSRYSLTRIRKRE